MSLISEPVLVTGGTGYIASWIVKKLLESGVHVRTTVRSKSNRTKKEHLELIAQKASGTLEVFEADLLEDGSFSEAMDGCGIVFHVASPFLLGKIKNPEKTVVQPALEGTRNVLNTVNCTESVKRVVLTSSVVAIYGDAIDIQTTEQEIFTEKYWNETSSVSHNPYSYSKKVAEEEAWRIADSQDRWRLVVINPGFVMGPSLSKRIDFSSAEFMRSMLNGKFKTGAADMDFCLVDVRDVAEAHILAATRPDASGRHILVSDTLSFIDFAKILRGRYENKYALPRRVAPKAMLYLFGPIVGGLSLKYILRNVGIRMRFDNSYSKENLGIEYTPIDQTLIDHTEQLIADGLV